MGDLGRESQSSTTRQEQSVQHTLPVTPTVQQLRQDCRGRVSCISALAALQLLLVVAARQGTGQLGTQEWKTHLPFAESFNIIRCTALPGSQSDASTDLLSHQRILHSDHLVGTEGRVSLQSSPPAALCACRLSQPDPLQDARVELCLGCHKRPARAAVSHQALLEGLPAACRRKCGSAGWAPRRQRLPLVLQY